ncbi:SNF2 family N-terminal domain-containing protein [Cytidiella melzeri]|nr:SNF2 family N-terminal domain-containing protein [Cytidiella melzeri]
MVRSTRQSARLVASISASATPTTARSPVFSTKTSIKSDTPETSDIDEEFIVRSQKTFTTTNSVKNGKKRAREPESETEASSKRPGRVWPTKSVYVEMMPSIYSSKKGKGKATLVASNDDEVIPNSEDELEYDEKTSIAESSESGSEFELSHEESIAGSQDEDDITPEIKLRSYAEALEDEGIDAEDVLMDFAVKESLQTAQNALSTANGSSSAGAGFSRSKEPRNAAAALRAAAAERRASRARNEPVVVDDDEDFEDEDQAMSDLSGEEPSAKKSKGKKKDKADVRSRSKVMTFVDIRKRKYEDRQAARSRKAEERSLIEKLGRKLTQAEKNAIALEKHHPELQDVWGDLERTVSVTIPQKAPQPAGLRATLLPFQQESLYWMKKQEQTIWKGGMLADEMGMGKTIQMIALLISDKGVKPNLVVAPTVAVMQWRNEIQTHSEGLEVLVWHGASRESDIKALKKYDVVVTTYAIIESCFRKQHSGFKRKGLIIKEKSAIHQIKWNRIILDEAHNIKERSTNTAKAAFELQSNYKWCLSGTPLQNRVGELYSLIRFLGGDPFSYYFCKRCDCKSLHWKFSDKRTCDECGHSPMQHTCFWNNEILTPIQKHGMSGPGQKAFKKLRILLDRMMLRRTKVERADDLGLPPRTVTIRNDYFSPEEKELYRSLFSDAKRQFNTFVDSGTVLNNYSNIFSLLTRMRQMACHPDLVLRSKTNAGRFIPDEDGEATVCRICNDIAEDAIQAKCRHIYDRECIKQYLNTAIEQTPACPVCHVPLTIDLDAPALELEANAVVRQGILGRLDLDKWRSSSKIEALVEELSNLRNQDSTTKSIVFSQFVNFLDLIAYRLQKAGFSVCRLEGTMSPQARDATIKYFMNNVHVTVFLVSLKAGGVALNLTEANRVYLMDSWWNPAVEYQAMDRIHRLGQHRPVQAIKLVVEDSIESRIIQLQEKKKAMVDATLSTDDSVSRATTCEMFKPESNTP